MPAITRIFASICFVLLSVLYLPADASAQGAPKAVTVKAGTISHTVSGFKALPEIPASWTLKRYRSIAKPKPAPAGHIWYVIKGASKNEGTDERNFSSTGLAIIDGAGKKYRPKVAMSQYQPRETAVIHTKLAPGQTKNWLAFLRCRFRRQI